MGQEFIEELISKVNLTMSGGIEEDVKGFFRENDTIKEYKMKVIQNDRYELHIVLKNPPKHTNEKIFFDFMRFMKYSEINVFSIANSHYGNKYTFLSATKDMVGFCFEVYFER